MNNQQNPIGQGLNPIRPQPAGPIGQSGTAVRPVEPRPTVSPGPGSGTAPGAAPAAHNDGESGQTASKIQLFEQRMGARRHEDKWSRSPNVTGTGAIHVKSFHCKLIGDSLDFLDQQINEWLDAHPQYEVKFVSASIGEWTGKVREPNLIVQVWV